MRRAEARPRRSGALAQERADIVLAEDNAKRAGASAVHLDQALVALDELRKAYAALLATLPERPRRGALGADEVTRIQELARRVGRRRWPTAGAGHDRAGAGGAALRRADRSGAAPGRGHCDDQR
jgi:hypothetical protein